MTPTSPGLFPTSGLRVLSKDENRQRSQARACTLPQDNIPKCTGQLHIGLFFDGTGNNLVEDYDGIKAEDQVKAMRSGTIPKPSPDFNPELERKHTNVVRLFHTHPENKREGFYRFYIPGVGTPFPVIGDEGDPGGSKFGKNGEARIIWGITRILNTVHHYVMKGFMLSDADSKDFSNGGHDVRKLRAAQEKLQAILRGKKPELTLINLSVFGFSRGAAEARTFVHWLYDACEAKKGDDGKIIGWKFAGIPIRLAFLGIFDTVASVGLTDALADGKLNGHQSWGSEKWMRLHPAIEQCVHFVAGHEVRACFPLDSARVDDDYPGNVKEVMYPGAHSDVGGGYAPGALGVCEASNSPTANNFLSTIPGADMYWEAYKAGVALQRWEELPEETRADLTPTPEVIKAFNDYVSACGVRDGQVEDMHVQHMSLFFSYRFKYRAPTQFEKRPWYLRANAKDKSYLAETCMQLPNRLMALEDRYQKVTDPNYDPKKAAKQHQVQTSIKGKEVQGGIPMEDQELWRVAESIDVSKLTPAVERLFGHYVHDSMAGFIGFGMNEYRWNRMGIVRFRTIYDGHARARGRWGEPSAHGSAVPSFEPIDDRVAAEKAAKAAAQSNSRDQPANTPANFVS